MSFFMPKNRTALGVYHERGTNNNATIFKFCAINIVYNWANFCNNCGLFIQFDSWILNYRISTNNFSSINWLNKRG